MTVSGSDLNSTPSGSEMSETRIALPATRIADVDDDLARQVGGQRLDLELMRRLLQHAAVLDALRLALEPHVDARHDQLGHRDLEQVDVDQAVADGVELVVLEHGVRVALAARHLQLQHRVAAGLARQRLAQRRHVDLEGDRLGTAAVQDPGDQTGLAQVAHMLGLAGVAGFENEGIGHGRNPCERVRAAPDARRASRSLGALAVVAPLGSRAPAAVSEAGRPSRTASRVHRWIDGCG